MIVKVDNSNIENCVILANKLWQDNNKEELLDEFKELLEGENEEVFMYFLEGYGYIGFIQLSLRYDYVEGSCSTPVAYIEGIYVDKPFRRKGIALELVKFAEEWGKDRECKELASDCELDNNLSIDFHNRVGFNEVNRLVCFVKSI